MGGTTAKICLIEHGAPQSAREFEVDRAARFTKGSGLAIRIPVIEMIEIGAGGGSIARIDNLGRIAVGPRSAGADPGPAAYGLGGEHPTVTDADAVLGRIEPDLFAGGQIALDVARAETSIERAIGAPLNVTTPLGALGISEMIDETMANAARVHAVERGQDAAEHALVAFGGAAPLHVGRLAEKLGIDQIVVPSDAGVGSAVGFLQAPVAYEVVRSRTMALDELDTGAINAIFVEMHAEAHAVVEAGAPRECLVEARGAYMRYRGQGHEIRVELPVRSLRPEDDATLRRAFDEEYERLYARVLPEADVEVLTWILSMSNAPTEPAPRPAASPSTPAPRAAREREVLDPHTGEPRSLPLYARASLEIGATLDGPALVTEPATSTYVPGGFTATVVAGGHLMLDRRSDRLASEERNHE